MRKIRLMTMVWGERHIDWFKRACVASLCWPSNFEALRGNVAAWDIYTQKKDFAAVRKIASALDCKINLIDLGTIGAVSWTLQDCVVREFKFCLQHDQAMMIAPPDTIFADGTIGTLMQLGQRRGVVIAVPHVRCTPSFLEVVDGQLDNARMVNIAWNNLHQTWTHAELGHPENNSWWGGVSWERIKSSDLIMVQHRLPTAYYVNVLQSDLDWYLDQSQVGVYDHLWPAKLVDEERQRVVASSDAAFIVELTMPDDNHPPPTTSDPLEPDRFWRQELHNKINRNVVAIFREG